MPQLLHEVGGPSAVDAPGFDRSRRRSSSNASPRGEGVDLVDVVENDAGDIAEVSKAEIVRP